MAVPVYLFAGFLESGKTSFIASILQDPGFTRDEETLLIQCEEGEMEIEPQVLRKTKTVVENIEDEDEFTEETLRDMVKRNHPDRVIVEFNGMWNLDEAIGRFPSSMELFQIITICNAETFDMYSRNMGAKMLQHLTDGDMIVFNRATEETRSLIRDVNVRAMNPRASIYFENVDGTSEDYGAGMPPPYDMDAEVIDIRDDWFGIFYIDASENPERYDGRKVRLKGETYFGRGFADNEFVPGRQAMVCCAEDIRLVGFMAILQGQPRPAAKSWQLIEATVHCEERPEYKGLGPVLYVESITPCAPPQEEVVTF